VTEQAQARRARFGLFELDLRLGELRRDGQSVLLSDQALQLLSLLLEHDGELVSRDQLKKLLWPNDTVVEFDHGINNTIKNIRRLLGDTADNPQYIQTIPRRGYRLMVPVEWIGTGDSSPEESFAESSSGDTDALPKATLRVGRLTGKIVSHYRVLEVIGGGGMGLVYRAEDLKLGRAVALKFLPEEVGDDPKARERFEREAYAVSALDHSNICSIYELDEHEGHPFIVMQLLQGKTLRDHLAKGRFRLTQPEGLEIAIQIASGLEAAHEKGIIHRDIKPANIFITEKNVAKILDFGVAKVIQLSDNPHPANTGPNGAHELHPSAGVILSERAAIGARSEGPAVSDVAAAAPAHTTTLTRTGMKLGTAGYMSPEQVSGEPLDARTDIFSFGLVLYEMATGERAFTGETEVILHDAIQHRDPKPVRELAPATSSELQSIIQRCLRKDRESRYQNAAQIRLELQQSSGATIETRKRSARRWLAIAAIAMVCAATAVGWLYRRRSQLPKLKAGATIIFSRTVNATNDPVLDQALASPLSIEFLQAPFFYGLGSDKIRQTLKVLKLPEDSQLTPELARSVCQQTHSDAVVQSSIKDAGNRYVIELAGVRCDSGAEIAKSQVETDRRNQIIKMLGVAGAQLRAKLGEPADSVRAYNTPLDEATSASLEALQAADQGWGTHARNDVAALPYYKEAVELDPKFARAQLNMGVLYLNAGEHAHAAERLRAAFALRQRLTQRDQITIEALYYSFVTGEIDKAIAAYERGVEIFPREFTKHADLSYHLRIIGQPERAAAEAREGFRIEPWYSEIYNLALSEMALGRPENAKRALDDAQKLALAPDQLGLVRYLLAFYQGNRATMEQQGTLALGKPEFESMLTSKEAESAAIVGQFRKARLLAAQAASSAQKDGISETSNRLLLEQAFREAEVGNVSFARNTLMKIRPLGDGMYMNSLVAIIMANSGDIAGAEKLTARISENHPLNTLAQKFWLPAAWALIDMHKNDPAQAIQKLEVYSRLELAQPGEWEPFGNMYPTYVRGLAYLKANQGGNAAREFQKIIDHRGLVLNFIIGSLAHLQLARAYVMMGDKDAARKSYQDFLTLWKDADPDIPIYRQAKAEYAKLQKRSTR
jgi:serine/threonine protein kinase/tetratricopeptide (TPR) repeat protein